MSSQIRLEQTNDPSIKPKCPSCQKAVETLLTKSVKGGIFNESTLILCPHCHTIIGYGKVNYF
jgi:uncharacterized protein with PIN domain